MMLTASGGIGGRLESLLVRFQGERSGNLATDCLDAIGDNRGMTKLGRHVGCQRFLDLLGPHAVEGNAIGEIIDDCFPAPCHRLCTTRQ